MPYRVALTLRVSGSEHLILGVIITTVIVATLVFWQSSDTLIALVAVGVLKQVFR